MNAYKYITPQSSINSEIISEFSKVSEYSYKNHVYFNPVAMKVQNPHLKYNITYNFTAPTKRHKPNGNTVSMLKISKCC